MKKGNNHKEDQNGLGIGRLRIGSTEWELDYTRQIVNHHKYKKVVQCQESIRVLERHTEKQKTNREQRVRILEKVEIHRTPPEIQN